MAKAKVKEYSFDPFKDGLTKTAILTFLECPRLFYFRFIRGWALAEMDESMIFGILFHSCVEFYYKNLDGPVELEHIPDTILENWEGEHDYETWGLEKRQQWEIIKAKLIAVFPAYVHWYRKDDAAFMWREIEHIIDVPLDVGLTAPVKITGKIDGVFTRGKVNGIIEHKTKGRINLGGLQNTVLHDFQVNLYMWAANKTWGAKSDTFIYNIIHNPSLRLGQKETPDDFCERIKNDIRKNPADYFIRLEQKMSTAHLAKFEAQLKPVVRRIVEFWQTGKNSEDTFTPNCLGPWGQCDLLGMCYRGDSLGLERREYVHPELHE